MKLKKVTIHKYKSFENDQEFLVEDDVSILVGMNESGKTSALEAIAKTNYFQDDEDFSFNTTRDYPRREKKKMDKSGKTPDAITCTYTIDDSLLGEISADLGENIFNASSFSVTTKYDNSRTISLSKSDLSSFITLKTKEFGISSTTLDSKVQELKTKSDLADLIEDYSDEAKVTGLKKFDIYLPSKEHWDDYLGQYVWKTYLSPNLPKFLYYDEYYSLPSRISIENLESGASQEEDQKTAKALLELADLQPSEITSADSFEDFIAELEATEATISDELFEYWSTNSNLSIEFKIDKIERTQNGHRTIVEHVLDIRVKNQRTRVSLPLKNRSKGFNWFFSFLVWFKKIQEDKDSKYVLLLDEPGLNLHASAQADMLRFIENLSEEYQVIYSTHSPFSIPSDKLQRVRTILDTPDGSKISDSIQEKDPDTLFPLQAALGYDIAQNLFVSKKNLLVEGVSDLVILTTMSNILEVAGRTSLRENITIVPTGGLEKVATFISLLRGSKLEIGCLLDSYSDAKGKAKLENLIREKIIAKGKIRFFDEYIDGASRADIEDLFTKKDYLKLFNQGFEQFKDVALSDLNEEIDQIIIQLNKHLEIPRFNHYRPASILASSGMTIDDFDEQTLSQFEAVFAASNDLFKS